MPISAEELRKKLAQQRAAKQTPEKPPPRAQAPRQPAKDQDTLPDLPQIEQAVLQVIFANADAGFSAFEHSARKSFFVNPINRELYNIARAFHQEQGRLDWIAFTTHLTKVGRFEELGGHRYITDLFVPLGGATPPFEMLGYYIRQLGENYVRRQLIVRSFALAGKAKTDDVTKLLDGMTESADDLRRAGGGPNGAVDFGLDELLAFDILHDPNCLVGRRFLVRGGSWMIAGPTGCGKSSLHIQLGIYWTTGTAIFGMRPVRPLKMLVFQAEDDFGDVAEEYQGIFAGIQAQEDLDLEKLKGQIRKNLIVKRMRGVSGDDFLALLDQYAQIHKPDLVGINPLFAFAGRDISDASIGTWLRDKLFARGEKHGYCTIVMHHTPKPPKEGEPSGNSLYLGFGSSEVQNSFRAVSTLMPVKGSPGVWKLDFGKRANRAGAKNPDGKDTNALYLEHSKEAICWLQVPEPENESGKMDEIMQEMDFEKPVRASALQERMYKEYDLPRRTFFRAWKRMQKEGLIKEIKRGKEKGWVVVDATSATGASATF